MVTYPKDWETTTLGNLGDVKMCKRIFQSQTKSVGQIPFYKIGTFCGKADAFITRELYEDYKQKYSFPTKGDVLLSAAGTIGRTFVYDGKEAYFQDSNIVWLSINPDEVDRGFLRYYYESYPWQNLEGTTISRLYNGLILGTEIHLPSYPEQRAIASVLSSFDTHIANLLELIEKKKAIRDGVLEDLVRGKIRLDGHECSWIKTELGEIASYRKERTFAERRSYISTENMNQMFAGITPYEGKELVGGTAFYEGDTLIANIRPYLKKVWCADFSGSCSPDVLVLAGNEKIVPKILYYYIANDRFINYVMTGGVKGIKMLRGDKKYILQYPILIPSDIKEQEAIAGMLGAIDEEILALETECEKMVQIREGAMDDLLTGRVRLNA